MTETRPKNPRCDNVSERGVKCLRKPLPGNTKCSTHAKLSDAPRAEINKECAICLLEEEEDMYLLSCHHRFHIECLKGMNKLECPLCRSEIINLPTNVAAKIRENGRQYAQEQSEERDQLARMIQREINGEALSRIPPQMEALLGLRYLYQLGIPAHRIPTTTDIELDPESPLPAPGSIFQVMVSRIISEIQQQAASHPEEEDVSDPENEDFSDYTSDSDEDEIFRLEGHNPDRIRHTIRTVPAPNPRSLSLAHQVPAIFNTISIDLSEMDQMPGLDGFSSDENPFDSDDDFDDAD